MSTVTSIDQTAASGPVVAGGDIPALFEQAGLSLADVALRARVSKGTASRISRDLYGSDSEATQRVRLVLADAIAAKTGGGPTVAVGPQQFDFASEGQRLMSAVLAATVADGEFSMVVGPSGCGKSWCIGYMVDRHPATQVLRARLGLGYTGMLRRLCQLWGLPHSGTSDQRMDRLLAAAPGMVLVVDEADLLVAGRRAGSALRMLEPFRQLHEAGATVVLCGLPDLYDSLVRAGETYVFRRIGYFRRVKPPTAEELGRMWERSMVAYPTAAAKSGPVALQARRYGLFGYLMKLARRTRTLDGDLEAASSLLFRPEY